MAFDFKKAFNSQVKVANIQIFADYRYYPNQVVYHKVFDALTEKGKVK